MPSCRYFGKNAASTSSREKPQVIWVRSFVPKEKNSALRAIEPAVSAPLGTSIIVPMGICSCMPASASTSLSTCSVSPRATSISWTAATSGVSISGRGPCPPA